MDLEYDEKKDPNIRRIVGLGDSFVFGTVPYEFHFLTLLDNKLKNSEVINMGIPGTNLADYLLLLETEGIQYSPDIVICNLFIGNDLTGKMSADTNSMFVYSLLKYVINVSLHVYSGSVYGDYIYIDDEASFTKEKFLEIELSRSTIYNKKHNYHNKNLKEITMLVNQMKILCEKNNSELLIVLIPDEIQVNPDIQKYVREQQTNYKSEDFDFNLPNRLLIEKLDQSGIEYLDLLPEFKRVSVDQRLYKLRDTHWNIAGNALASKLIYERIHSGVINTILYP